MEVTEEEEVAGQSVDQDELESVYHDAPASILEDVDIDLKNMCIGVQGGRRYLPVAPRIMFFRKNFPNWSSDKTIINLTDDSCLSRCEIRDQSGILRASDYKYEDRKGFGDFIEKSLTGAEGRALAALGIGTLLAQELISADSGSNPVDSPQPARDGSAPKCTQSGCGRSVPITQAKNSVEKFGVVLCAKDMSLASKQRMADNEQAQAALNADAPKPSRPKSPASEVTKPTPPANVEAPAPAATPPDNSGETERDKQESIIKTVQGQINTLFSGWPSDLVIAWTNYAKQSYGCEAFQLLPYTELIAFNNLLVQSSKAFSNNLNPFPPGFVPTAFAPTDKMIEDDTRLKLLFRTRHEIRSLTEDFRRKLLTKAKEKYGSDNYEQDWTIANFESAIETFDTLRKQERIPALPDKIASEIEEYIAKIDNKYSDPFSAYPTWVKFNPDPFAEDQDAQDAGGAGELMDDDDPFDLGG